MFGLFKSDPVKKLEKEYERKMDAARAATRSGKIPLSATLTAEAEEIARRIDALRKEN
jgi:hypothetical protein